MNQIPKTLSSLFSAYSSEKKPSTHSKAFANAFCEGLYKGSETIPIFVHESQLSGHNSQTRNNVRCFECCDGKIIDPKVSGSDFYRVNVTIKNIDNSNAVEKKLKLFPINQ